MRKSPCFIGLFSFLALDTYHDSYHACNQAAPTQSKLGVRRKRRRFTVANTAGVAVASFGVTATAVALLTGVQLDLFDAAEVVRAPEARPVVHGVDTRHPSHAPAAHLEPAQLGRDVTVQLTGQRISFTPGTVTATQGPSMPVQLDLFA